MTLPIRRPRALVISLVLLGALACKKERHEVAPQPAETPASTPPRALTNGDVSAVCEGKPEKRAADYDAKPHAHTLLVFRQSGESYSKEGPSSLEAWGPKEAKDTELVACVRRTKQEKVSSCTFDNGRVLDLYSATYELRVLAAKTGDELAKKEIALDEGGCPTTWFFSSNHDASYPSFDTPLLSLVRPFVWPDGATGDAPASSGTLYTYDLPNVCLGFPEPRAAAFVKEKGKSAPFLVMRRYDDENAPYYSVGSYGEDPDPKADEASLVVCVREHASSRKKGSVCKFDEQQPVKTLDMYGATWDVDVVEAKTAKKIASKSFVSPPDVCPLVWMFHSDHDVDVAFPVEKIRAYAKTVGK